MIVTLVVGLALVMTGRAPAADGGAPSEAMLTLGRELFARQWKPNDPRCHGGDGLGPVYNAASCLACHYLGGPGGAGDTSRDAILLNANTNRPDLETTLHPGFRDSQTLVFHHFSVEQAQYDGWRQVLRHKVQRLAPGHPRQPDRGPASFTRRNTPPLFGAGAIDAIPEDVLIAAASRRDDRFPEIRGRVHRMSGGRIGRFGWKAQVVSLRDFVLTACANEIGLESPGHPQAPSPLHFEDRAAAPDLTPEECDALVAYVGGLPAPTPAAGSETLRAGAVGEGRALFDEIGCAACHVPSLGNVQGIYSDLLLHDMGSSLSDGGTYYGIDLDSPRGREWRTPPLWGLRESAPYMHDGRAPTWREAVVAHGGEARPTFERFAQLSESDQEKIGVFLGSLGPLPGARSARPGPEATYPPPMNPTQHMAAQLAVARNLEKSGKLPAALDAYRELVRDGPETDEARIAAARLRELGAGEPTGPGPVDLDGPSPTRRHARSMLYSAPKGTARGESGR